ncbi:MAG TPA: GGDEF domain-containing protein [Xanthomonadaceae bacterium]|nr:GGDEF domain-containing protein [Xanthomonadaceae bacterium]
MSDHITDTQRTIHSPGPGRNAAEGAALVVIHGDPLGKRVSLGVELVIGRAPEAGFQIAHRSVSRQHCRFWLEDGVYRVRDLGSTNRTFVNQQPVVEAILQDGDLITVGETILKFIAEGSVEARYHEELHQMAMVDALTELANRRQFQELLEKELRRAAREQASFCLMILDIDLFKAINDRYGHPAGDVVLKRVAAVIREHTGESVWGARIGGEEFALVLRDTVFKQAFAIAERLREEVAAQRIEIDGLEHGVTVSIGIAEWGAGLVTYSDLMRAADHQLYRAKSGGRNRVEPRPAGA